ncbi:cytochrome P450 [Thelephora ganbajun]|uniref:Cytochrome P450 n=1 Tax=Thelephora ganbajun TaxID=370292 RepID=A0ACB6Z5J2_THEGA|nr:cytochrome P450 [Thelephora ganbajun]
MWPFSRDSVSVTRVACATVGIVGTLYLADRMKRTGRREKPSPSGSPTLPIVGNLTIPSNEKVWDRLTGWTRQYGEIYSLKLGPGNAVILSSMAAVKEIVEKNSGLITGRSRSALMDSTADGVLTICIARRWRPVREFLTFQACQQHLGIQHAEATQLMFDILSEPINFCNQIRRYAASTAFSVVFGKRTPQPTTPEVIEFFAAQHSLELLPEPDVVRPFGVIPMLQHVSEGWTRRKKLANQTRRLETLYSKLCDELVANINAEKKNGCWMETVVERGPEMGLDEGQVVKFGGTLIEDGPDTTSAFLQTFVFALMNWPEAQKRAQEEVEMVIGPDRIPAVQDIDDLPYVQALIKETHRWRPTVPLALPHTTIGNILYKEYVIPQDTEVYVNNWTIMHDSGIFEDPESFRPERWFQLGLRDERIFDLMFGIGKYACPGQNLARNSINLNAMNFLWAFNISRAKYPSGREKVYDLNDFSPGLLVAPNPFECVITPRSGGRAGIIRSEFSNAIPHFEPFEQAMNPEDKDHVAKLRRQAKASFT